MRNNLMSNKVNAIILRHLSKALGGIRRKLWRALYGEGLPVELMKMGKSGRGGNSLCGRRSNKVIDLICSNVGGYFAVSH